MVIQGWVSTLFIYCCVAAEYFLTAFEFIPV